LFSAGQFWEQVPRELRGALLSAGSHIFFRVSAHDATILAAELAPGGRHRHHGQLTTLERGQALVRVGSAAPELVTIPPLPRRAAAVPIDELRAIAQQRYSRRRTEVEQEITSRRAEMTAPRTIPNTDDPINEPTAGQAHW
jgi:hypothetical protein